MLMEQNKVVIITGTNNPEGIGAAIARTFAHNGYKLVLVYKKLEYAFDEQDTLKPGYNRYFKALANDGGQLTNELTSMNAGFIVIEDDITRGNAPQDIFSQAMSTFRRVDVLINNAAEFSEKDSLAEITAEELDKVYAVNTKASVLMSQEFVRNFKGENGRIIFFSTDAAQNMAGQIIYGATKAANESLTRSLAVELGPKNITVNCIAPGPTQTGWIGTELEKLVLPDIPTGRLTKPEDIAAVVLFLCSGKAGQITGQILKVSGGHNL